MIEMAFHFPCVNEMTEKRESESIIDMDEALVFTAGDRELLISMAKLFLEEGPRQLQAVLVRIEAGDAPGIRKSAHTLKGSVVIFGARKAEAAAIEVEHAATDNELSRVPEAWVALNREMKRLLHEVEKLCSD